MPSKHCAERKKPGTEGPILYDSLYREYPEQVNPERQCRLVVDGQRGRRSGVKLLSGEGVLFYAE